jgi:hypothetical protein
VPDLVATSDRKGMSPMDVVAVLTRVVKEQQEAIQGQNKVVAVLTGVVKEQQAAMQQQEQVNTEQQQVNQEQRQAVKAQEEINRELINKLAELDAEVKQLRQSAADERLARLAN